MKRFFLFVCLLTSVILQANAGGLVTNSNQSATYYRMLARGASISGDALYYNPAGLAFLDQGFTISLNTQMIWMKRIINNDLSTLNNPEFTGKLYVPFFPGLYAAYKTGNFTFSLGFNPPAGGGSIEFADGLPMLENTFSLMPKNVLNNSTLGLITNGYQMQSMLKGTSIVYGVQAGAAYRINEMISVSGGVRMMFASNSYEGYAKDIEFNPSSAALTALGITADGTMRSAPTFLNAYGRFLEGLGLLTEGATMKALSDGAKNENLILDAKQKGSGIAPIFGVHFQVNSLNLAAKYEFNTKITIKNETDPAKNAMNLYPDGKELRSDVPALLSLAGSYDIIPALKLSVTYLHHFEPQAKIESWDGTKVVQRQDFIDKGTNEYQFGVEWKITDKFTISTGCQWSDVNVSDLWQNDITHNLDNLTFGLGAAYQISDRLTLNIGGLNTWYSPVTVKGAASIQGNFSTAYNQKYDRKNTAIAIGIDFKF